jgi:hypothetical protein
MTELRPLWAARESGGAPPPNLRGTIRIVPWPPPQFDHSTQVQGCVREAGVSLGDGWIPHKS